MACSLLWCSTHHCAVIVAAPRQLQEVLAGAGRVLLVQLSARGRDGEGVQVGRLAAAAACGDGPRW